MHVVLGKNSLFRRLPAPVDDEGAPSSSLSTTMTSSDNAPGGELAWAPPPVSERLAFVDELDGARKPVYASPSSANISAILLEDPPCVERWNPENTGRSFWSSSRASTSITSWLTVVSGNEATIVSVADMASPSASCEYEEVVDDMRKQVWRLWRGHRLDRRATQQANASAKAD